MKWPFLMLGTLCLVVAGTGQESKTTKTCPEPKPAKDSKFRPGQVWHYKTRPGEESSTLTVLKVESLPKIGTIVHVRFDGVRLRNCTGGPEPNTIEHAPFARATIEASVTKSMGEDSTVPDFADGYKQWRADCGGVYTISPAEMLQVAEDTMNQNLGCETPQRSDLKSSTE